MKAETVVTSNVRMFVGALEQLERRGTGEEGMGLLCGHPGEGKSTTIAYLINNRQGIYLRARVTWSVTSMLRSIMAELRLEPGHYRDRMIEAIIEELTASPRPLFIDEADYLFRQTDMLDALRDVYDSSKVPVILVGMDEIASRIRSNEKFSRFRRRITQWVEFKGLTLEDTRLVADRICEVEVDDGLVERLHTEMRGNIGHIIIGLSKIERYGRTNRTARVTLAAYGNRPLN